MTVAISRDGTGRSWSATKELHAAPPPGAGSLSSFGYARYCDLAIAADGNAVCLYTHGVVRDSEKISAVRFGLDWLDDVQEPQVAPAGMGAAAAAPSVEGAEGGEAVQALISKPTSAAKSKL